MNIFEERDMYVKKSMRSDMNKIFVFTVDHLSKYLAMRLTLDLDTELSESDRLLNFCIYIAPLPGPFVVLSGSLTLRQVNDKFWRVNRPLEMYYSWKKT
jgi:E3 ubiquitin-protein ligase RNF1/2